MSNNTDEGFEPGTTNELLSFLYIARGSAGELRSMIALKLRRAGKRRWPVDLKSQISNDFKFEMFRQMLLSPIARLGRLSAEFAHQGPATSHRDIATA